MSETTSSYRHVSPLFADTGKSGKHVFPDQMARIVLYQMCWGTDRRLHRVRVHGDVVGDGRSNFAINPFETTRAELGERFGGGEFYIEAYGHDGHILPGGHSIWLPGRPRPRTVDVPLGPKRLSRSGVRRKTIMQFEDLLVAVEQKVSVMRALLEQEKTSWVRGPAGGRRRRRDQ